MGLRRNQEVYTELEVVVEVYGQAQLVTASEITCDTYIPPPLYQRLYCVNESPFYHLLSADLD